LVRSRDHETLHYHSSSLPCYLIPLMPNILISTLFSNTLSLCSSLTVRGQVQHPHKTTGKIIVLYCFYIYVFGQQTGRQKLLDWIVAGVPWIHLLSISSQMQFLFASVVHKHFNFATLSKDLVPIFRLWFYSASVHEMWHIISFSYACITVTLYLLIAFSKKNSLYFMC